MRTWWISSLSPTISKNEMKLNTCPAMEEKDEQDNRDRPLQNTAVRPQDILCGRGKAAYNHAGNKRFRRVIAAAVPGYGNACHKTQKRQLIDNIVRSLHVSGTRFLRVNPVSDEVAELSASECVEKVGRALRDADNTRTTLTSSVQQVQLKPAVPSRMEMQCSSLTTCMRCPVMNISTFSPGHFQHYEDDARGSGKDLDMQHATIHSSSPFVSLTDSESEFLALIDDVLGPLDPHDLDPLDLLFVDDAL